MKKITLNHITKVEGHAEVNIKIKDGKIEECHVHSVEGSRYFEGIIKGRKWDEVTLITSRICGICSCGHTIASITAIENAFNIKPSIQSELLRELITIGERIRSHASHLYFFALPDYLGFESAIAMAKTHSQEVRNCLEMIRVGNKLIELIGGRDMHPFCAVAGGFTHIPTKEDLQEILKELKNIIPFAENTIKLFASLEVPQYEKPETVFASLGNHSAFPLHNGEIVTNTGLKFKKEDYQNFIEEYFEPGSTAKFATVKGKEFMTGALARCYNAFDKLSPRVQEYAKAVPKFPNANLFLNNFAQALETLHWLERAIDILENNEFKPEKIIKPQLPEKSVRGVGVIEVPRGILFHDYHFNKDGILESANIITPTVQNLPEMESGVKAYLNEILEKNPEKEKDDLVIEIEKMIRAASTHVSPAQLTFYKLIGKSRKIIFEIPFQ